MMIRESIVCLAEIKGGVGLRWRLGVLQLVKIERFDVEQLQDI